MPVQKHLFPERTFSLAIAPWNAPATLSFRAICIPLICGNTVVLKSSEYSPISQEIVVEVMHEVCGFEIIYSDWCTHLFIRQEYPLAS